MNRAPASVLLVNDTPDEREMYAEYLQSLGFRTLQAGTADDGCRLARELLPDAIVTDMVLVGGKSGVDLTVDLRNDERTRLIPVIMLTGRVFETDRIMATRAGVDLFLSKPCLPPQLAQEINGVLVRSPFVRVRPEHKRLKPAKALLKPEPDETSRGRGPLSRKKG